MISTVHVVVVLAR